jgi:tetratricopeptide (TPR) repeat protein
MYLAIPDLKSDLEADGYNNRGICKRALGQSDLAIADYNKAIDLNPRDARFLVNRGKEFADQGKFDQAMADFDRALEVRPNYAYAYAHRGLLFGRMSRMNDAIKDFDRAIEADPTKPEAYYDRGETYSRMKEYAKAIPDYDKYISLIGDNLVYLADGYLNRGIAHHYTGNAQRALADLSKVIELRPTFANGYKARAMLYREMKKNDLAEADEKKAAELSK